MVGTGGRRDVNTLTVSRSDFRSRAAKGPLSSISGAGPPALRATSGFTDIDATLSEPIAGYGHREPHLGTYGPVHHLVGVADHCTRGLAILIPEPR